MFHFNLPRHNFFYYLVAVLIVIALFGCSTEKRIQKARGFLEEHGRVVVPADRLDSLCALHFPVRDSVITRDSITFDTLYIYAGEDTGTIDTTEIIIPREADCPKCPKSTVILKTVYKDTIRYIRDMAAIHEAQRLQKQAEAAYRDSNYLHTRQLAAAQAQVVATKETSDWWKRIALIAIGLHILVFGYKLLKTRLKLPF